MIRLLLADDHPMVRVGLRALISVEPNMEVITETATAGKAVRVCAGTEIDLVLMDLQFDRVRATRESMRPGCCGRRERPRACRRRSSDVTRACLGIGPQPAGDRGARARRGGLIRPGYRPRAVPQRSDREVPPRAHLHQARGELAHLAHHQGAGDRRDPLSTVPRRADVRRHSSP